MNHLFSAARRMLIPVLLTALLVTGAKTPGGGFFLPEVLPTAAAAEPEAGPVLNILLIGRDDRKDAECARSDAMILCSVSRDNGHTWAYHSEVIRVKQPGGVWEPHFIMIDGKVAVFYSNVPASPGFAIASVALNYVAQDNKPDKPAEK